MKKEAGKEGLLFLSKIISSNKKAQVWIETAMYILIATVIIGLVISFVGPKISEMQDKAILENSATMLKDLDNLISSIVQDGAGNVRKIELPLKKGSLVINSSSDKIIFEMEGRYAYSEPEKAVTQGSLMIYTRQTGNLNIVNMTSSYPNYDITFNGVDQVKSISQSPNPYTIYITNQGSPNINSKPVINFEIR